jgi:pyruvate formate lyase activating enzyme
LLDGSDHYGARTPRVSESDGMDGNGANGPQGATAIVSQIIHGSFVDGHGIRTTVFLKGCPLRCVWCCNPEGQRPHAELKYVASLCNGCGRCVDVCPLGAITLEATGPEGGEREIRAGIDRDVCDDCGACIEVCFLGALGWFGRRYSVDELFDEVKKDEKYYSASGGGVTIGGGEPTMQPEFLRRFLQKCRTRHIHTALDTCLHTVTEDGVKALEEADLLLVDIKHLDPEAHSRDTGVANEVILRNLRHLGNLRKPMIIRVPLIPGHTDTPENLRAIVDLLCSLPSVERVDLLPVHEYGKGKYEELGMEYRLEADAIPHERQQEIKALFEECGLTTQIGG